MILTRKKYLQNHIWLSFWPLHDDQYTSSTYCKYVLYSFYPEESNGDNYTIMLHSKNILLQDKANSIVSSKSRVEYQK